MSECQYEHYQLVLQADLDANDVSPYFMKGDVVFFVKNQKLRIAIVTDVRQRREFDDQTVKILPLNVNDNNPRFSEYEVNKSKARTTLRHVNQVQKYIEKANDPVLEFLRKITTVPCNTIIRKVAPVELTAGNGVDLLIAQLTGIVLTAVCPTTTTAVTTTTTSTTTRQHQQCLHHQRPRQPLQRPSVKKKLTVN